MIVREMCVRQGGQVISPVSELRTTSGTRAQCLVILTVVRYIVNSAHVVVDNVLIFAGGIVRRCRVNPHSFSLKSFWSALIIPNRDYLMPRQCP